MRFEMRWVAGLIGAVAVVSAGAAVGPSVGDPVEGKPNILFVLADDLGWRDLACYGNPVHETPHLDRLAREGLSFTDAYAAAPICSASRAAIMTGKSTARLGFEFVVKDAAGRQPMETPLSAPPFVLNLDPEDATIAEVLGAAGYATGFFGKWHLNAHHGSYLGWSPEHGPKARGFAVAEEDFGSYPYGWVEEAPAEGLVEYEEGEFPEDSMTQRAVRFVEEEREEPFFLMVSHFYVHTPVATPCAWLVAKYLAKLPESDSRREKRAVYAAFVEILDHYVGELVAALDRSGQGEETLVVFTSDNGGHPEFAGNAPLRGSKWNLYEGGVRVPMIARWPGAIERGGTCGEPVIGYDLLPTFAEVAGAESGSGLDGMSLVEFFRDPELERDRALFWHFPYYHPEKGFAKAPPVIGVDDGYTSQTRPHSAMRFGDRKVLYFYEDERSEVFDIVRDESEEVNLIPVEGWTEALQLRGRLQEYLRSVSARFPEEREPEAN